MRDFDYDVINRELDGQSPREIIAWGMATFGDDLVASTSFGIHSAALLHIISEVAPEMKIIWVDTGYLPPETLAYASRLTRVLNLNLVVAKSSVSPERMEAECGRLWEQGTIEALDLYDWIRKIEPMHRTLNELGATAWLAGLRTDQTKLRSSLPLLGSQWGRCKLLPTLRWTARDVNDYIDRRDLPRHPLAACGYNSVGDWHSSRPTKDGDADERSARYQGLKQECGLHFLDNPPEWTAAARLDSPQSERMSPRPTR